MLLTTTIMVIIEHTPLGVCFVNLSTTILHICMYRSSNSMAKLPVLGSYFAMGIAMGVAVREGNKIVPAWPVETTDLDSIITVYMVQVQRIRAVTGWH